MTDDPEWRAMMLKAARDLGLPDPEAAAKRMAITHPRPPTPDPDATPAAGPAPPPEPPPLTADAIRKLPRAEQRRLAADPASWETVRATLSGRRDPAAPLTADELAHLERLDAATLNANWDAVAKELRRRDAAKKETTR